MKKLALIVFALTAGIVSSQSASAQVYDFTFTYGSNVIASGVLDVTGNTVTSGTAALSATAPNDPGVAFNILPLPGGPGVYTSPSELFLYDNWINPAGPTGSYLDNVAGLLFVSGSGDELNLFSGYGTIGNPDSYSFESGGNYGAGGGWGINGTFAIRQVPEYSGLSMLILCALALAGAFFYKGKQSSLFLNS